MQGLLTDPRRDRGGDRRGGLKEMASSTKFCLAETRDSLAILGELSVAGRAVEGLAAVVRRGVLAGPKMLGDLSPRDGNADRSHVGFSALGVMMELVTMRSPDLFRDVGSLSFPTEVGGR